MPQSLFTFTPSLPWVALGLTSLAAIQVDFLSRLTQQGIRFVAGEVTAWDPQARTLGVGEERLTYDYVIVATGADLDLGAVPGASCFGPAYEFALLADFVLRKRGLRQQVPITLITPEPYAGHLGIGGMANAADLVGRLLQQRQIRVLENVAITEVTPTAVQLHSGEKIPFSYGMVLPPFRGAAFLRQTPGVADAKGFIPVLPTYQHPHFDSIYGVGVITELLPPEVTPLPVGVPKTGQMTEAMGMAVAHNIAVKLGALAGDPVTPTLEAICFADFGTTGIVFLADPVLPQPGLGRRRALAVQGRWVSWLKTAFEGYFLMKMRQGWAVPWFERWGLRMLGLSLVEPEGHG
ncbi:MAG: hypothetical protein Q6K99_08665 [Thermostichales cyanobacterium BF4_bins_65]